MKSIIFRQHTVQNKVHHLALYLFGVCAYAEEYPVYEPAQRKPVGFIQFPSAAPDEVEDEDDYEDDNLKQP